MVKYRFCLAAIAAVVFVSPSFSQPGSPAWKPNYSPDRFPPKSDSDHVWLHIDGPYVKRSPTCTKPNEIWQGFGYNWDSC